MENKIIIKSIIVIIAGILLGNPDAQTHVFAQQYTIPGWVREVAGSWSHGQSNESNFVNSLLYMTQNDTLQIPTTYGTVLTSPKIPSWIRNVAGWWADYKISDNDYVNLLQWSIDNNVLVIVEGQQRQIMVNQPRLIATFAPQLDDSLLSVLDKYKTDFGISFRIKNLQTYDSQKRILLGYSSESIDKAILQAGSAFMQIKYIGYDNEPNNGNLSTPTDETTDPAYFTNRLADTVHTAGFKYAITPSRDMLQLEYQKVDWTKIDLIVIQMQKITGNETRYHNFLDPITSFIKEKSPNTLVLVQVNPQFDSIQNIASVVKGTKNIDGISIVVIGSTSNDIDNLLTLLSR